MLETTNFRGQFMWEAYKLAVPVSQPAEHYGYPE
jgi:hypothetical protein